MFGKDGNTEYAGAEVLLHLLINNSEEMKLKHQPCGISDNLSCTFIGDSSCVTAHCEDGTLSTSVVAPNIKRFMLIVRKYTN